MNTVVCGDKDLIPSNKTIVMGVVNVTPDSFSDGGLYHTTDRAIAHGLQLVADGADILDVGGVATSTYARAKTTVSADEELDRVIPVILGLRKDGLTALSVDTKRASVAKAALDAGASWVNDQSAALFDADMPAVMARANAAILMHDGGGKEAGVYAGEEVIYDDIISHLREFFIERICSLARAGVKRENIILDPGVGFGKGLKDSITIINNIGKLNDMAGLTMLGLSRKSFLGKITGIKEASQRDFATLGADAMAVISGVKLLRTHNVKAAVQMTQVINYCINAKGGACENIY